MDDLILKLFSWITDLLKNNISECYKNGTVEYEIMDEFKCNWGKKDTKTLLIYLTDKYGDNAYEAVDQFLEYYIRKGWAETGSKMAVEGEEIDTFIKLLWEPLKPIGFVYSMDRKNKDAFFCVTECPIYEAAKTTGLHKWLYHLACKTDFYSATSFSSKIDFRRTKTLIEGDNCCDHCYYCKI